MTFSCWRRPSPTSRGVLVRQQPPRDVGEGRLQQLELGVQRQADALLRQEGPDDEGEALGDPDGVFEEQLVELGGEPAEAEVAQAAAAEGGAPRVPQLPRDGRGFC